MKKTIYRSLGVILIVGSLLLAIQKRPKVTGLRIATQYYAEMLREHRQLSEDDIEKTYNLLYFYSRTPSIIVYGFSGCVALIGIMILIIGYIDTKDIKRGGRISPQE